MIGQETHEVERKIRAILQILSDSPRPLGGRVVAQRLKEQGIDLNERTVRYHLKIMDERGFTRQMGDRDGRMITELGLEELRSALVCDKIGFVTDRLKVLAFFTPCHGANGRRFPSGSVYQQPGGCSPRR
jgi:repressor of nif and glnA expression